MVEQQPSTSTRILSAELGPSQSTINWHLRKMWLCLKWLNNSQAQALVYCQQNLILHKVPSIDTSISWALWSDTAELLIKAWNTKNFWYNLAYDISNKKKSLTVWPTNLINIKIFKKNITRKNGNNGLLTESWNTKKTIENKVLSRFWVACIQVRWSAF